MQVIFKDKESVPDSRYFMYNNKLYLSVAHLLSRGNYNCVDLEKGEFDYVMTEKMRPVNVDVIISNTSVNKVSKLTKGHYYLSVVYKKHALCVYDSEENKNFFVDLIGGIVYNDKSHQGLNLELETKIIIKEYL